MSADSPPSRPPIDVLIVAAVREEWAAVLEVETGASSGSEWTPLDDSKPEVRTRMFETERGKLHIAVVQAFGMGGAQAAMVAAPLLERYKTEIRCLAMCGVCAGRRGDVSLGDVIIADRSWAHDAGKLKATMEADGTLNEVFQGDVELYRIQPPDWKQAAERFQPVLDAQWVTKRPVSYETQGEWVLERLLHNEDPQRHIDRRTRCADWTRVVQQLWKVRWLKDGTLTLSDEGRAHIERRVLLHPDGLPPASPLAVVLGPIASGAPVVEDPTIFDRLAATQGMRKVLGLEMETSTILALAYLRKLPFAIVMKGVMDHADVFKSDNMKSFAASASAECLIAFLRQYLPANPSGDELKAIELRAVSLEARVHAGRLLGLWRQHHKFNACGLVRLRLIKKGEQDKREPESIALEQVAQQIQKAGDVVLYGQPGAGKTFTLLQLADLLYANEDAPIPVVISVAAWVSSSMGLGAFIAQLLFSSGDSEVKARLLFESGRVALLMNGWNEAEEQRQLTANDALRDFALHFPKVPLLITTRDSKIQPATPDAIVVQVAHLSEEQKATIVRASELPNPERFLDHLAANANLAVVTDTPLFLAAAIRLALKGRSVPNTRAVLLDAFVDEAERSDNHLDALQSGPCRGFHREFLECLAESMMMGGRTVLSADECHKVLADSGRALTMKGHLSSPVSGADVADSLLRHHVLVLVPGARRIYAFLHQQFQELFAAHSIERRVLTLIEKPEEAGVFALKRDVLDRQNCQVPVEMTVELLGMAREHTAVAQLVRWCMSLDLVVAAKLFDVGGQQVLNALRDEFFTSLRRLYAIGGQHRRCALAAMLATGESEFSDLLWAELEGDEQPFYRLISLCRGHVPFRANSLGPGWQRRVSSWPERKLEAFILEVNAGDAELAFAEEQTASALPDVRRAAFALLEHQGRPEHVIRTLSSTKVEDWPMGLVAEHWPRLPSDLRERILARASGLFSEAQDQKQKRGVIDILRVSKDATWIALVRDEMESMVAQLDQIASDWTMFVPLPVSTIAYGAGLLIDVDRDWVVAWTEKTLGTHLWRRPFVSLLKVFSEGAIRDRLERVIDPAELKVLSKAVPDVCEHRPDAVVSLVRLYLRTRDENLKSALRELPLSALAVAIEPLVGQFGALEDRGVFVELLFPRQLSDPRLDQHLQSSLQQAVRRLVHRFAFSLSDGAAEETTAHAYLSLLLASIRNRDDFPVVKEWTDKERARWEDYYLRSAEERRRLPCYGASWWWFFRVAVARFQSSEAEQLLGQWLDSPFLLGDGAWGLVEFSMRDGSLSPLPASLTTWPTSHPGTVKVEKRRVRVDARVAARGTLIIKALEREGANARFETRYATAQAVLALANFNDERAIAFILGVDSPLSESEAVEAAFAMAQRGSILPGELLAQRFESYLVSRTTLGRIDDIDSWQGVLRALAVLLGSDAPRVGVARIRALLGVAPRVHRYRDLCSLLAASLDVAAANALLEMSRSLSLDDVCYLELVQSLSASAQVECHMRVLDIICDSQSHGDGLRRQLKSVGVGLATGSGSFAREMIARLATATGEVAKRMAEVLAEIGSQEAAAALLAYPKLGHIEGSLRRLVQMMTDTRTPVPNHPGAHRILPRESTWLRRQLAALLLSPDPEHCAIASRLLVGLRVKRIENGEPAGEPLHPDVTLLDRRDDSWELWGAMPSRE